MAIRGARNKERGYEFEKEIEALARTFELNAHRTWGSNGRAERLPENVDVHVGDLHLQCKRQKRKVSKRYIPAENIHAQLIRGDYQSPFAVLEAEKYFRMIQLLTKHNLINQL